MEILEIKFNEVPENTFGIVITGADISQVDNKAGWVNGITNHLKERGAVLEVALELPPEKLWEDIRYATTTGGRTDLIFIGDSIKFDIGRFAMVRLQMSDCSWVEDWLINYASHYGRLPRGPHADSTTDALDFDESD